MIFMIQNCDWFMIDYCTVIYYSMGFDFALRRLEVGVMIQFASNIICFEPKFA